MYKIFVFVVQCCIGLSSGILVSGGMYALITTLGIINRFAQEMHTASDIIYYEECVIWGGTIGNILFVLNVHVPLGVAGYIIFGLAGGIYAGCLAIALAEMIKTIPVFIKRTALTTGIEYVILSMALAKGFGGLIYFFTFHYRQ